MSVIRKLLGQAKLHCGAHDLIGRSSCDDFESRKHEVIVKCHHVTATNEDDSRQTIVFAMRHPRPYPSSVSTEPIVFLAVLEIRKVEFDPSIAKMDGRPALLDEAKPRHS